VKAFGQEDGLTVPLEDDGGCFRSVAGAEVGSALEDWVT
jgi:hypothetical protein